jgi:bacteriorhodopsin
MVIKIWIGIGIFFLLLTWWAVIDITKKDFGSLPKKALWGFTALIPFLGPLLYFAIGYRRGRKVQENADHKDAAPK